MDSENNDQNSGKLCPSCFNVLPIFSFCLECDVERAVCSCKKEFPSFAEYKDHLKLHDENSASVISCEIKLKQLENIRHIFICTLCMSVFKGQRAVNIHFKSVHSVSKNYSCYHCSRNYKTKLSLHRHIQTHLEQPTYVCDICKKKYFRFSHLEYHILSHLNTKSYACNFCEKSFIDQNSLSRHLKQHTTDRPYRCEQCDKLFKFHFTLKKHRLTHTRGNSFTCDICKKSYKWKYDLHRHILGHVQGKSFSCPVCCKTFVRKSYLAEHKQSHSAAKMHLCFCGKSFKFLSGLSKHRISHKKEQSS